MKRQNQAFVLYPTRPFDHTWNSATWGYPILAERRGPFDVADPDNPRKRMTIERLELRGQPGYEIVHSIPLPPGELPEGLQPEEPFTDADKDLLARLDLGEVVDGVLLPLDPRGMREWTRLKTYLLEICRVREDSLPILRWEEILAILGQHANPDRMIAPKPAGGPLPRDEHRRYERPMSKRDIGIAFGLDPDDHKIAEKVDSMVESWGGQLHKVNRTSYLVPLDILPLHFLERFRQYVKDFHGVEL